MKKSRRASKLKLRSFFTFLTLLSCTLLSFSLHAPSAQAHTQLISSFPSNNSTVAMSPTALTLTFSEPILSSADETFLLNSRGEKIKTTYLYNFDLKKITATITLTPALPLPEDTYLVNWKVISKDKHLIAGAYNFTVGSTSSAMETKTENNSESPSKDYTILPPLEKIYQTLFWLSLILLFGSLLVYQQKLSYLFLALLLTTSLLRFTQMYTSIGKFTLQTGTGKISLLGTLSATIITLLLYLASLNKLSKHKNTLFKLSLIIVVALFSSQSLLEGHALDIASKPYLPYISMLHLVAAILWCGSIVALLIKRNYEQYLLTRKLATIGLTFLLLFGTLLSLSLALPLNTIDKTTWIVYLLIKVVLLLIALGIGAYHHFYAKRTKLSSNFSLTRSLAVELITMVLILLVTSLLVSKVPPKVYAQQNSITKISTLQKSSYQEKIIFSEDWTAMMTLENVSVGKPATMMLQFTNLKDESLELSTQEVSLFLSNKALKITDLPFTLAGGKNHFMALVTIPALGTWHFHLQAQVDDFTLYQANHDLKIN